MFALPNWVVYRLQVVRLTVTDAARNVGQRGVAFSDECFLLADCLHVIVPAVLCYFVQLHQRLPVPVARRFKPVNELFFHLFELFSFRFCFARFEISEHELLRINLFVHMLLVFHRP